MTILDIDRAIFELRRGRAIAIDGKKFIHPEFVTKQIWTKLKKAKLIVTAIRAKALFDQSFKYPVAVDLVKTKFTDLPILFGTNNQEINLPIFATEQTTNCPALKLASLGELMPAIIQFEGKLDAFKISAKDIGKYEKSLGSKLTVSAEAPLNLQDAKKAWVKAFRPATGNSEHLAIIIGDLDKEPLIRVHSSCYTGDLLGSLTCDCGDQLKGAIRLMDKEGGGIILYLLQEGRGIGLINKLRAYSLQAGGMDTVEANEFLGFDDEERSFAPAVTMLKNLGVSRVKLISNNPKKAKELEKLGIKVTKLVPMIIKHKHNENYLNTKAKKSGHLIK